MVAEMGFEPHDLRVMSPTSYQAALLRDIYAGDRDRTGTVLSYHGILSPGRLPVPPHRRVVRKASPDASLGSQGLLYHNTGTLSIPFLKIF